MAMDDHDDSLEVLLHWTKSLAENSNLTTTAATTTTSTSTSTLAANLTRRSFRYVIVNINTKIIKIEDPPDDGSIKKKDCLHQFFENIDISPIWVFIVFCIIVTFLLTALCLFTYLEIKLDRTSSWENIQNPELQKIAKDGNVYWMEKELEQGKKCRVDDNHNISA